MVAAVRLRRRGDDPLDPGALDDMGRALKRSMSDDDLIAAGHAVRWTGRGARPTP